MSTRTYLDANFFIRFVESEDTGLLSVFEREAEGLLALVTSELTLAEVLAGALKLRDARLVSHYEEFLTTSDFLEMAPITRDVLRDSAGIRATLGNKLPDAIHVATALNARCDIFVSSDQRLRLPPQLTRIALDQVANMDMWP